MGFIKWLFHFNLIKPVCDSHHLPRDKEQQYRPTYTCTHMMVSMWRGAVHANEGSLVHMLESKSSPWPAIWSHGDDTRLAPTVRSAVQLRMCFVLTQDNHGRPRMSTTWISRRHHKNQETSNSLSQCRTPCGQANPAGKEIRCHQESL